MVTEKMNYHEMKKPTAEHSRPPSQPHVTSPHLTFRRNGLSCSSFSIYIRLQIILLIQQIQAALRGAIFHEFR